jgi:hypothetical protein
VPQNLSPQLDPIPIPSATPVDVQTSQGMFSTPPDPQQYSGGRAGAVADIANKVLTGWMTGKYIGEQKRARDAAEQIGTMKATVDQAGEVYRKAQESGDPKQIEQAGKILDQQWKEYNDAREKYVIPPNLEPGAKKTVGQKVKGGLNKMFAPQEPHMYLQAAITAAKQLDPKQVYGMSKSEQEQGELGSLELKAKKEALGEEEKKAAATHRYEDILNKPTDKQTADDKRYMETYEQLYLGRTKQDLLKDDVIDAVKAGRPLTDAQRTIAEQMGLVKPQIVSTQIHTTMDKNGNPYSEIIAIGPDGKMVGQPQRIPGRDYVPPNQAQMAEQVIQSETSAYVNLLKKAHPEFKKPDGTWDDAQLYSIALGTIAKNPAMDWAMKNQQMDVTNRALLKLLQAHSKTYKDSDGNPVRQLDDEGQALLSHFVTAGDDGRYQWNASLGAPDTHWFGPDTYGPYTRQQLDQYDKQARAELRAILKEQNKGLSDTQIDQMMPPSGFDKTDVGTQPRPNTATPGMTPPPAAPGTQQLPALGASGGRFRMPQQGAGPGGTKMYNVKVQGGTVQRTMTQDQVDALKAQGVEVTPAAAY